MNIGTGEDIPIRDSAELVRGIVGYEGRIRWDHTKPDGTPRKLLDVSKMGALGWKSIIDLDTGIKKTYGWFKENYDDK